MTFTDTLSVFFFSARKIHLSEATFLALQKLGNYDTEYRGELAIKVIRA